MGLAYSSLCIILRTSLTWGFEVEFGQPSMNYVMQIGN